MRIKEDYFEWVCHWVHQKKNSKMISYNKLLSLLHNIEFTFSIPKDINRAKDGVDLRYKYALELGLDDVPECLDDGPCSMLEMLVALALRCETMMDNPRYGDRTSQWFWKMIGNLGLGDMYDARFDEENVVTIIERFLARDYKPDGRGGLFIIKHCSIDLRSVEIWTQLNWYLDTMI